MKCSNGLTVAVNEIILNLFDCNSISWRKQTEIFNKY